MVTFSSFKNASSCGNRLKCTASFDAHERQTDSASELLNDVTFCFLDSQEIALFPKKNVEAEYDFRQSAST